MPDEALLEPAFLDPLHNFVGSLVLLEAWDHLDAPSAFPRGKQTEIPQDVQQPLWLQQVEELIAHFTQPDLAGNGIGIVLHPPWRPMLQRAAHASVIELLSFCGKGQDVGHEELRHCILIHLMNLRSPI